MKYSYNFFQHGDPRESKQYKYKTLSEAKPNTTPEMHLWLAVLERAIYDYCQFGDFICRRTSALKKSGHSKWKVRSFNDVIRNYRYLRSFLFEPEPALFNAQLIWEIALPAEWEEAIDKARELIETTHDKNISMYAAVPIVAEFLPLYEEETGKIVTPMAVDEVDLGDYVKPPLNFRQRLQRNRN